MRTMPEYVELQNSCSLRTGVSSRIQKIQVIIEKTVPTRSCMTICLRSRKLLALMNIVEKENGAQSNNCSLPKTLPAAFLSARFCRLRQIFLRSACDLLCFVLFHVRVQWLYNEKKKNERVSIHCSSRHMC